MKPLSQLQSLAFTLGGLLLLVGALLPMVPTLSDFAPYVFCAGALLFGTLQLIQRYEGRNVTVRRLRRQQMLGACLLMISACLLLVTAFRLLPLRGHCCRARALHRLPPTHRIGKGGKRHIVAPQGLYFNRAVHPYSSELTQLPRPFIYGPGSCLYNRVPLVLRSPGPACMSGHAISVLRDRKAVHPRDSSAPHRKGEHTARQRCKNLAHASD